MVCIVTAIICYHTPLSHAWLNNAVYKYVRFSLTQGGSIASRSQKKDMQKISVVHRIVSHTIRNS